MCKNVHNNTPKKKKKQNNKKDLQVAQVSWQVNQLFKFLYNCENKENCAKQNHQDKF